MNAVTVETARKSSPRISMPRAGYDTAFLFYAGCVVVALVYYLLFFNYGIDLDDEGFFIGGASAIGRSGQYPLADFQSYPPWMYFSLAGFFHIFGETLRIERALLICHLLIDIVCLLWLARKVLPPVIALIPVLFYAMAPGSWYRVFFVFGVLVVAVALFHFNEKPTRRRALLVGLAIGFAAIARVEVAVVSLLVFVAALLLVAFCDIRDGERIGSVALRRLADGAVSVVGFAVPPMIVAIPYAATGKLDALVGNVIRYINPASYGHGVAGRGLGDMFRPWALVSDPRLEQWVYAVALAACLALVGINALRLLVSSPEHFVWLRRRILLGAMAIASMGETFFFVWNSRMLSTFAIVMLAIVTLLNDATGPLPRRCRIPLFAGGCAAILAVIVSFSNTVDYYSGSIAVFRRDIEYRQTIQPFLEGARIWQPQADTIDQLYRIAKEHPDATMVPMTYSTTLGYLSGLRNPTYYRLFTAAEMPGEKGQEEAVRTFERNKITYFVARRGTFFSDDDPGAVQTMILPLVKDYLLSHYDVRSLGENYIILVRRAGL
jgi:hypothetical protein